MNRRLPLLVLGVCAAACGHADFSAHDEKKPVDDAELGATAEPLTKVNLTAPIESDHPYKDNVVQTWKVQTPGCALHFRVHFDFIDVEEGYDFVRILDKDGNKLKSYTGFYRGWSPQLPGTEATIELISDRSNGGRGFKIDAIEYSDDDATGTWTSHTLPTVISTDHPYANGTTKSWTVKGPAGTTRMRLQFKSFDTEARYDIVSLFDRDLQQVATYTGNLNGFISAEVEGEEVTVRFSSDYSVTGYGFDIVGFEAFTPGGPGTCASPSGCLTITPKDHDFGNVREGCSATRSFDVYNTCDQPVSVDALTVAAGKEFTLVNAPTPGTLIQPGQTTPLQFQARYAPVDLGADKGRLELSATEKTGKLLYKLELDGVGDLNGVNRDEFTQGNAAADILLVIDDSCSMSDKQQQLAQNLASFISYAQSWNVDYRIGVTTTDVDLAHAAKGRLISHPTTHPEKWLEATTPDLATKFAAKVKVGIRGSTDEKCYEASHRALTEPLLSGDNAGFLRKNASLAVICVTDEVEQSTNPVSFYQGALLNAKDNDANKLTYSVIGGFSKVAGCFSDLDNGRFAQMTAATGGVKEDICSSNWAAALQNIGKSAAGHRSSFVLTAAPELGSTAKPVTVTVDGVNLPAVDGTGKTLWSIDAATKTLTFASAAAPTSGQKLVVEYYVACAP